MNQQIKINNNNINVKFPIIDPNYYHNLYHCIFNNT